MSDRASGAARPSRRRFLRWAGAGAALSIAGLVGMRFAVPRWLRPAKPGPLGARARDLVAAALDGLDASRVWDGHVHLVGADEGGNGCRVSPAMRSHASPVLRFQLDAYLAACGITGPQTADREYLDRLLALGNVAYPAGRMVVLPFDVVVREDGTEDLDASHFVVPDAYAATVARRYPDRFVAACSVHPYRHDAVERLRAAASAGAVAVKWLPNSHAIDPGSPRCDRFYEALAELGLPLLAHVGGELAMAAPFPEFGNPLRLRRALDHGCRVILGHAASSGTNLDLDAPERTRAEVPAFDLAVRLLHERRYDGRVLADISALTAVNRCGRPLRHLLSATALHGKLLNASDYPICAIGPLVSTWLLTQRGYLDDDERAALDEIRTSNPLLGDLVLKRRLAVRDGGRVLRFADEVFETERWYRRLSR